MPKAFLFLYTRDGFIIHIRNFLNAVATAYIFQ